MIIVYSNGRPRSYSFSFVIWENILNENLVHISNNIITVFISFVKNTGSFTLDYRTKFTLQPKAAKGRFKREDKLSPSTPAAPPPCFLRQKSGQTLAMVPIITELKIFNVTQHMTSCLVGTQLVFPLND